MNKRWRIRVSALGSEEIDASAVVEAANWMTALKAGRAAIGESGGLPPGANLRHESNGSVTILDGRNRRTYRLALAEDDESTAAGPGGAGSASGGRSVKKHSKARAKTIAYIPGDALPSLTPSATPETPRRSSRPPPPTGAAPTGPSAFADARAPAAAPQPSTAADDVAEVSVELLNSVDAEPSEQSPLRYRERAFAVTAGISADQAETIAQQELATVQESLAEFPTGKLVVITVFDHVWEDQPLRPPLVQLEWKDWKGTPVLTRPLEDWRATHPRASTLSPAEQMHVAQEACQDLFFLQRPIEALEFSTRLLAELLPVEVVVVHAFDPRNNQLRPASATPLEGVTNRASDVSVGLLGAAAQDPSRVLVVNDASRNPRYDDTADAIPGFPVANMLFRAITHQGRPLGVLQLAHLPGSSFSNSDADIVSYVADHVGAFIAHLTSKGARAGA